MTAQDRIQLAAPAKTGCSRSKLKWQPVRPELTVFMHQRVTCTACRMMHEAAGRPITPVLHIHRTGKTLVITEADDLHQAGRSLVAAHVRDDETGAVFRLLDQPPPGMTVERFRPGEGSAVVSRLHGRQRLVVTGSAAGLTAHAGALIEAVEISA
jgi:hypothetical protein